MKSRIIPIVRKEFIHIIRDPRSLTIILFLPIFMILIFGYAFNADLKNIKMGVIDYSQSAKSRMLIEKFTSSGYFVLVDYYQKLEEIESQIKERNLQMALIIPRDYAESIQKNFTTRIQVLIDGSNSQSATIIKNYISLITVDVSAELSFVELQMPLDIRINIWYNPELKTIYFFVPGIIAMILIMISALLTCIAIAKEKEMGTLEQILVSPIKATEIVIGKVLPYILLAFLDGLFIILVGVLWFGVPFRGSVILLLALAIVYIYASLSYGLLISTVAPSLRVAMLITLATTVMPSMLLSGFIFPIESMPTILQAITYIVPAKYFLIISRGIILKGIGIQYLWEQVLFLVIMGTIFLAISAKRFKPRLE
ncbi:ABC transporter permease [candidate division KSB1 bacterium]|nr:ABC transporter permease [candidate division KSB1 bacterium]